MSRVEALETQNARFKQENDRLSSDNDDVNQRLTRQNDDHRRLENRVTQLTHELNALKQSQTAENVNSQQQMTLNPQHPEPDTRSQFTAFACTLNTGTMYCPSGRTILTTSGVYGRYNDACDDGCCAPNPMLDCTELVEDNSPSDWLDLQALCDGEAPSSATDESSLCTEVSSVDVAAF